MNQSELYNIADQTVSDLEVKYEYVSGEDKPYKVINLNKLRNSLKKLIKVPFLKHDIENGLMKIIGESSNVKYLDSSNHSTLTRRVERIRYGLLFFIRFNKNQEQANKESSILIKLPELKSFEDLSKISNEFKKAIEIPLTDSKIESEVNILSAQPGSIWIIVGLGSLAALNLIAGIAWSAAVIRKKHAEAKIFEEHTKTLELKNEQIEIFVDAQKKQINNLLQTEAEALASKHYDLKDPEILKRLQLSINTVSELIDKGAKILPMTNSEDVKQLFPEYDKLSIIQSSIKKLTGS